MFEVAAATARLLKHHARSGAWVEITPGRALARPRALAATATAALARARPNCPSDMSDLSENSD